MNSAFSASRVACTDSGAALAISVAISMRCRAHVFLRDQPVGQAHRVRFVAGNALARVQQPARALLADQSRQRDRQAESRKEADGGEVRGEPRFLAGDAEVGNDGKTEAGTDRAAVNRRDDGLARRDEPARFLVDVARQARTNLLACGFDVQALLQIASRAEVLALGGEHDAAALRLAVQALELGRQVGDPVRRRGSCSAGDAARWSQRDRRAIRPMSSEGIGIS